MSVQTFLRKFLVEETVAQNNIHFAIVITIIDNVCVMSLESLTRL